MNSYFESDAIGSSILSNVITGFDPGEVCTDLGIVPVEQTKFMGMGKAFEDLVEQEFSGRRVFYEKYFCANIPSIPAYNGADESIKQILDIMDIEDAEEREQAVENAYILKKGKPELNNTYKARHDCLDEIKHNKYRRPIPTQDYDNLMIMLERFSSYPFEISTSKLSLSEWSQNVDVQFQVEHFWEHDSGAECRAKFDMIWRWEVDGIVYAIPFDLKVTANWKSFKKHWTEWYIWQSKHYIQGFKNWCDGLGITPYHDTGNPLIWYLIQESTAPQITHALALSADELDRLDEAYNDAVPQVWEWIQQGRPVKGYTEQKIINRWGRSE